MIDMHTLKEKALRAGLAFALGVSLLGAAPTQAYAKPSCSCSAGPCANNSTCNASGGTNCVCNCNGTGGTASCNSNGMAVIRPGDFLNAIASANLMVLAADIKGALPGDETVDAVAAEMMFAAVAFDTGDAGSFYASMEKIDDLMNAFDQGEIDLTYQLAQADSLKPAAPNANINVVVP